MTTWLYQMDVKRYPHERYRAEVWEGSITANWGIGKIKPVPEKPQLGDIIILFYVKAHTIDPGVYGWGIVTWCDGEEIHFRPTFPSDYLKTNPAWDEDIDKIIDEIRGAMKMGNMWKLNTDVLKTIRQKISQHVYGVSS